MKLWTQNIPGNLFNAQNFINDGYAEGSADEVIHLESTGHNSLVVFKINDARYNYLRDQQLRKMEEWENRERFKL